MYRLHTLAVCNELFASPQLSHLIKRILRASANLHAGIRRLPSSSSSTPFFLQEEALNELLPFGEYRPPDQSTPSHVLLGIEAWELDRLLARLAVHGGSGRRSRAARHAARASRASATRAAAESSAASGSAAAAGGGAAGSVGGADSAGSDPHRAEAAATMPVPMQRDGRHGNGSGSGSGDSTNGEAYPASWPPAGYASRQYSRVSNVAAMWTVIMFACLQI